MKADLSDLLQHPFHPVLVFGGSDRQMDKMPVLWSALHFQDTKTGFFGGEIIYFTGKQTPSAVRHLHQVTR